MRMMMAATSDDVDGVNADDGPKDECKSACKPCPHKHGEIIRNMSNGPLLSSPLPHPPVTAIPTITVPRTVIPNIVVHTAIPAIAIQDMWLTIEPLTD